MFCYSSTHQVSGFYLNTWSCTLTRIGHNKLVNTEHKCYTHISCECIVTFNHFVCGVFKIREQ